jgi:hypothetical protein
MRMKKRYLALYSLIVVVIGIVSVRLIYLATNGVKSEPNVILTPSSFAQPAEIGTAIYRYFYAPIEQKKIVFFGLPPQPAWHQEILRGFLKAAAQEQRPFDLFIAEAEMPELNLEGLPSMKIVKLQTNTDTQSDLIEQLDLARKANQRVLVYTAAVLSSHLLPGNAITRLEANPSQPHYFAITSAPLSTGPAQEFEIDPPCVGSERDTDGTAALGCAIMSASRSYYRANIKREKAYFQKEHQDFYKTKYVSIMQQNGVGADYLLMTSAPSDVAKATPANNRAFRMRAPGPMEKRSVPNS